jgi:hypothetical protein
MADNGRKDIITDRCQIFGGTDLAPSENLGRRLGGPTSRPTKLADERQKKKDLKLIA